MERRKIHSQVCRPSRTLFASRDSFLAYDLMYVLLLEFSSELVPLCVLHSPHQPVTHVFPHGFLVFIKTISNGCLGHGVLLHSTPYTHTDC